MVVPRHIREEQFQPPDEVARFGVNTTPSMEKNRGPVPRGPAPMCGNHMKATKAGWRCDRCGKMLCEQCVNKREVRNMVLEVCACGGRCIPLSDRETGTRPSDAQQMATAFRYPLEGQGLPLLIVGALFFWISLFAMQYSFFVVTLSLIVFIWGYLSAYLIKIISTTAIGEDEPPDWPGAGDLWESIVRPFFLLCVASLMCFGPPFFFLFTDFSNVFAFWVLFALGGFVFPMALTAVAMAQTCTALNPFLLLRSIGQVPGSYLIACALFFFVVFLRIIGETVTGFIPFVGGILTAILSLYFMMVQARVLGMMYRLNQDKLQWF